jgi:integrase/recombinase XerD
MNDPSKVRVTGPLAGYVGGFRAELEARGYRPGTIANQLLLMAELSRWLDAHDHAVGDLTSERVEQFFATRRARVRVLYVSSRALRGLLDHLQGVGALRASEPVEPTPLELLLSRYHRFLLQERGLVKGTAARYVHIARKFFATCSRDATFDLGQVSAPAAVAFLIAEGGVRSAAWSKAVAVALRSLLRFLHVEGLIEAPLADAVPTPASWRAAALPEALEPSQLAALLASCNRRSVAGRRDYAVQLLLGRLGLRAGEVAGLELADVDWREGTIRVRGKGRRVDVLPLPADVGRALADYVRRGRPRTDHRAVFCRIGAPHGPLSPTSVTGIVYRSCDRAGLARVGAHRLRHGVATHMLRGGASLPDIAQVLRHASIATTAVYAKVDHLALGDLAQPWPGGGS